MKLKCLVLGHEDQMRRRAGGVCLECTECGRRTAGWDIATRGSRTLPQRSAPHTIQQIVQTLWQRLREGFDAVGLG
jgi:hypothetical protein